MPEQNKAVDDILALLYDRGFDPSMGALICAVALRCLSSNFDLAEKAMHFAEEMFDEVELERETA